MNYINEILHANCPWQYFEDNYSAIRSDCPYRLLNHTESFDKNERILLEAINVQTILDWLINIANTLDKAKLADIFEKADVYPVSANYVESL